ncbi:MAG: HAMP domain-containing histidine kinase [Kofleriaceae bacterium]|nr:HAMP domain-containing histidine kinase [Kofleriaceae bacterium]
MQSKLDSFDHVRDAQLRSVASAFLRVRPWIIAPVLIPVTILLWRAEVPRSQLVALPSGMAILLALFVFDAWRASRVDLSERAFVISMVITTAGLLAACLLSGGLLSPFLPIFLAPIVTLFAAYGRSRISWIAGGAMIFLLLPLALLAPSESFPVLPGSIRPIMNGVTLVVTTLLLFTSITGLTHAYDKLGTSRDALQRELLGEAQKRMRSLETLSAKLAHEIRNPLQSIKGLVQLEARSATGKRRLRFDVVCEEIARLEQVVGDYLSFSRPAGSLSRQRVDALELAHQAAATMEARARDRDVSVSVFGNAPFASIDPSAISMALLNILSNAIDASPPSSTIKIEVSEQGGVIEIAVIDSGEGMDEQALAQAGTAFVTTKEGGTGLGLAIARQIAEGHGGSIEMASIVKVGTTVRLSLPVVEKE